MRKNKLLLLLALLLTAATGAWATDVYVVGNGSDGNWVNGVVWDPGASDNKMTEQNGVYSITFTNVDANSELLFKFAINGSWNENFGCTSWDANELNKTLSNIEAGGANFKFGLTEKADVTISFNLSEMTYMISTKGMKVGDDAATGYSVSMKDGVKDAGKWTVKVGEGQAQALPIGGLKGDGSETVTLQYTGRLKVKGVKATSEAAPAAGKTVDLATLTADYEAKDGETLTGTLAGNYKITIADGATVTLDGVTINGVNDGSYEWAGITCDGDATIILSGTNTVKGFYEDYPGIQAAADKTLTINGTGSLTASSYGYGAGIGGGSGVACGNIEIQDGTITATSVEYGAGIGGGGNAACGNITISGGTVTATGGARGAGIGGGRRGLDNGSCGNILISGGTVTATGGDDAAGIGGGRGYNSGYKSSCGTITITTGVTSVTATKGESADNSIGAGNLGTCGTVTIGGVEGAITTSPYTYDPTAQAKEPATVTTAPTGAAVVGVGKTTALVSGGVADGGTLWYAVTTTNTKPASTDGFSDAVPTAKDITASGKVYVWYYVKGDDTHTDSEIAATAIEVPVADIVWDATNVSDLYVSGTGEYEKEGVKLSCNANQISAAWHNYGDPTKDGISFNTRETGGFTFTAPTGKAFAKIEMKANGPGGWSNANLGTGWAFNNTTVTWTGSASTVDLLTGANKFNKGTYISYIAFYLSE